MLMELPPGCGLVSGKVVRLNTRVCTDEGKHLDWCFEQCISDPCVLRFVKGDGSGDGCDSCG